jgi:hypothetical protein
MKEIIKGAVVIDPAFRSEVTLGDGKEKPGLHHGPQIQPTKMVPSARGREA